MHLKFHKSPGRMRLFLLLSLLIPLLLSPSVRAAEEPATEYQLKLDGLRDKISGMLSGLSDSTSRRNDLRQELQKLEVRIAKVAIALRNTEQKHLAASKKLDALRTDMNDLQQRLGQQRHLLSGQLRAAYSLGQQPQLKLLLNQKTPSEMGRSLVYFDYLNRSRSQAITRYIDDIQHQQHLEADIKKAVSKLTQLAAEQTTQKQQLDSSRQNRKALLENLNQDIEQQQLALKDLEASRTRIENLLMSLGELMADIPASAGDDKPFASLKGKLPWPVRGSFDAGFGDSRSQGGLKWNGMLIKATYGAPVRTISSGRVEFADWLQGFGFIVIVNHNDGYMTLYGHNQALYKKSGDWVETGETIATVGDSGGHQSSGLYFEIRYQGKPVDPQKWCSSNVRYAKSQ